MYFSVKNPIKIGGKCYKPCICYTVTPYLELTVKKLLEEDKITAYEKPVFFCNGKLLEEKTVEPVKTVEKPRKEKKAKESPVVEPEEEKPAEESAVAEDEGF